jgi:hypothetical protein
MRTFPKCPHPAEKQERHKQDNGEVWLACQWCGYARISDAVATPTE